MAQIMVTAAQLENTRAQLKNYVKQFENKIEETDWDVSSLKSMWEGDAADAFQASYKKDSAQLRKALAGLNTYDKALQQAIANYKKTEAQNVKNAHF